MGRGIDEDKRNLARRLAPAAHSRLDFDIQYKLATELDLDC
jgi:hypothetical protein